MRSGATGLGPSASRKNSSACVRSSRYDLTVCAEAFFSSARWRRNSARACSMQTRPFQRGVVLEAGSAGGSSASISTCSRALRAQDAPRRTSQAQVRVGGLVAERVDQVRLAVVVVDVDVAFGSLEQGQYVEFVRARFPRSTSLGRNELRFSVEQWYRTGCAAAFENLASRKVNSRWRSRARPARSPLFCQHERLPRPVPLGQSNPPTAGRVPHFPHVRYGEEPAFSFWRPYDLSNSVWGRGSSNVPGRPMPRKRPATKPSPAGSVTTELARLYRIVTLLHAGPKTRDELLRALQLDAARLLPGSGRSLAVMPSPSCWTTTGTASTNHSTGHWRICPSPIRA